MKGPEKAGGKGVLVGAERRHRSGPARRGMGIGGAKPVVSRDFSPGPEGRGEKSELVM
jgi:hypothetical protein